MSRRTADYLTRLPRHPFKLARALVSEPLTAPRKGWVPQRAHLEPPARQEPDCGPRSRADLPAWVAYQPILCLNNDGSLLVLTRLMLERAGLSLITATSATEALNICEHVPLSMIITNWSLPDIDGFALCRMIKRDRSLRHLPVVFITTCCRPSDRATAFEAGAVGFMSLPVMPSVLYGMVCDVLLTHSQWHIDPPIPNPAMIARLIQPPDAPSAEHRYNLSQDNITAPAIAWEPMPDADRLYTCKEGDCYHAPGGMVHLATSESAH